MKLFTILLTVCCISLAEKTMSQTVSFTGKNVKLETIFRSIEKQTNFFVIYEKQLLREAAPVTVKAEGMPLRDFLSKVLENQPLTFSIKNTTVFIERKKNSPQREVTSSIVDSPVMIAGTVTGLSNQPLVGATVRVKGKNIVTTSDGNGYFELNGEPGSILLISYVGYIEKEIKIENNFPLTIALEYVESHLDTTEVIINTGYQNIPRERATGSFQVIDNKTINMRVSPDLLSRIDGIASGFLNDKRTTEPTMQIRGLSTLDFNTRTPLFVVDNFPYEGDLNSINPNDIESINILKDAAATSIWGARAGNGVIVITTKKAKKQPLPQVSFNTNFSLTNKPDLYSAPQISVNEYIELEKYLFSLGRYESNFNEGQYDPVSPVVEILQQQKNKTITPEEAEQKINKLKQYDLRAEREKYLYKPALNQQYFLNISFGGTNSKHLLSFGYDDIQENLKGVYNKRFTVRVDNDFTISRKLTLSGGAMLVQSSQRRNEVDYYTSLSSSRYSIPPYTRIVGDNGEPLSIDPFYRSVFTDTAGGGKLLDWKYRPIDELNNSDNTTKHNEALVNAGVEYKLTNWISLSGKYQHQYFFDHNMVYDNLNSYNARDLINQFTQLTPDGIVYGVPKEGVLNQKRTVTQSSNLRAQLNIDKSWGNHQLTAIAGGERRLTNSDYEANTVYGYNKASKSSQSINGKDMLPTYNNMYGKTYIPDSRYFTATDKRFVSVFGNVGYTYRSKYNLTLSARKDASNLFGVNTNKKGVPLWSAGGKWMISTEPFFKSEWLKELSIRSTYGFSGNVNTSVSALTLIEYSDGARSTLNIPYVRLGSSANPNLRWEKVRMINYGIDFRLKKDILSGSFEYYDKYSYDLFNTVYLDPTSGLTYIEQNSAAIKGHGIDILLNAKLIDRMFKWSARLMHSYTFYKVTKNLAPPGTLGLATSGTYVFPVLGYNPYSIFSYRWAGLDPQNGDPLGYINGKISKDYQEINSKTSIENQVYHGSALPQHFGNIAHTLSWKNITVNLNFSYKLFYYLRKPALNYTSFFSGPNSKVPDWTKRWQKPGDEAITNVPSAIYPANSYRDQFYTNSEINVIKADHIRFQDLYLSYNLMLKKNTCFRSVELYAYSKNLNFLLWKANKEGIDPDVVYGIKPPLTIFFGLRTNIK